MKRRIGSIISSIKLHFRYKKCQHKEWKTFNSGYKQCVNCKKIVDGKENTNK